MADNVVDFNEALKRAEEQEQSKQNICEHCEIKQDWIATLLSRIQIIAQSETDELDADNFVELFGEMYDEAYDEGKREAYGDILGYAGYSIDIIDGVVED